MPVIEQAKVRPTSIGISPYSPEALGLGVRAMSGSGAPSAAYPVANLSISYPIRVGEVTTFIQGWVANGATASGNWDVGIYDDDGTRLGSTGSVAQSGTSALQAANLTSAVTVTPGKYRVVLAASATTLTFNEITTIAAVASALGIEQMATNFPLGTTFTPAAFAQTLFPVFGLSRKTTT